MRLRNRQRQINFKNFIFSIVDTESSIVKVCSESVEVKDR